MKKARFPLYAKILLWFFLNLVVLGAIVFVIASEQFRVGPEFFALSGAGDRLRSVAELVSDQLERQPRRDWDAELARFGSRLGVELLVYRNNGEQLAGRPTGLPLQVQQRLTERGRGPMRREEEAPEAAPPEFRPEGPRDDFDRPAGRAEFHAVPEGPRGGRAPFLVKQDDPKRYWIGLPMRPPDFRRGPVRLVIISRDLHAGGLLMDLKPWLWTALGVVVFSVLFWIPLVRHLTKPIAEIQAAATRIADGDFAVRLDDRRRDELGVVAASINRMSARLEGFVGGQKRFIGDIAHELCSPLARMQMALGILEERAEEKAKPYVNDVRDEAQHMSALVNEVLSFSKASLGASTVRLQPVGLREAIERAIRREAQDGIQLVNNVPAGLMAVADGELIARAIANLLRNAIRYAGDAGPIHVAASGGTDVVRLTVADNGSGVPETELPKLFDPFYRVDTSRARETGGVGLGLSIVKTCVESCRGTVSCRNRVPHGFEVEIVLPAVSQAA